MSVLQTADSSMNSSPNETVAAMESLVGKFEARLDEAQRGQPPSKQWARQALRRQGSLRCPVRLRRLSYDLILRYGEALADLYCQYPDDVVVIFPYDMFVGYQGPGQGEMIRPVEVLTRAAEWTDEWGTRWGHACGGVGATPLGHPITDLGKLDEYLALRMPDPLAEGRFSAAETAIAPHRHSRYAIGMIHQALFERLHALRGMQNVFLDFYSHPVEVHRLLSALADYLLALTRRWGQLGADAVLYTDDWGSQTGLMISPGMWREYFKPHYQRVFAEAHRLGMEVIFHSCGSVKQIVPDLIEVGIDVLDPLQPGPMDLEEIAERFGGRIAFSGGIDVQHLLARGSPEEIHRHVRKVIDQLGRPFGNSFLVAPANTLTPEIPLANLQALFEASHE